MWALQQFLDKFNLFVLLYLIKLIGFPYRFKSLSTHCSILFIWMSIVAYQFRMESRFEAYGIAKNNQVNCFSYVAGQFPMTKKMTKIAVAHECAIRSLGANALNSALISINIQAFSLEMINGLTTTINKSNTLHISHTSSTVFLILKFYYYCIYLFFFCRLRYNNITRTPQSENSKLYL